MTRILLVDDDLFQLKIYAGFFQDSGYDVVALSNPMEAIDVLYSDMELGALIADIFMPNVHGVALGKIARYRRPQMPVLLITGGEIEPEDLDEHHLLRKPVTKTMLLAKTSALINSASKRGESG
jgi:DNA-binding NtrC family response regulator